LPIEVVVIDAMCLDVPSFCLAAAISAISKQQPP
jgi:hypothetical protein